MHLSRGLALIAWLGSSAVISSTAGGTGFSAPGVAYAGSCAPVANNSGNQVAKSGVDTFANIEKSFSDARAAEGCSTPLALPISEATWTGYTPQQQVFVLYNAERQDRGLGTLTLDITLMSQIDVNHSQEMNQYGYFAHSSPINNPPPAASIFDRLTVNPAIANNCCNLGENIAGNGSAAAAVFEWMYDDGSSSFGHRHSILGYTGGGGFGNYNWVGVGVSTSSVYGLFFTTDFLQANNRYMPPAATDTSAPTMSAPTVAGAAGGTVTATATNVVDSGAGTGAAGLTSVRFYAGSPVDSTGNSTTVLGTQNGTTWTASLNQPAGTVVHAVAVDGSGNYTDLPSSSGPTAAHVTHLAVSHHGAQAVFRWSVAPNHQIAGFNLYAGTQRLNPHLIASMQRTSFRYSVRWSGQGRFNLEVVMSNGEVVHVAAR